MKSEEIKIGAHVHYKANSHVFNGIVKGACYNATGKINFKEISFIFKL